MDDNSWGGFWQLNTGGFFGGFNAAMRMIKVLGSQMRKKKYERKNEMILIAV